MVTFEVMIHHGTSIFIMFCKLSRVIWLVDRVGQLDQLVPVHPVVAPACLRRFIEMFIRSSGGAPGDEQDREWCHVVAAVAGDFQRILEGSFDQGPVGVSSCRETVSIIRSHTINTGYTLVSVILRINLFTMTFLSDPARHSST